LKKRIVVLGGATEDAARPVAHTPQTPSRSLDCHESTFAVKLVTQHVMRTAGSIRCAIAEAYKLGAADIAGVLTNTSLRLTKASEFLGEHLRARGNNPLESLQSLQARVEISY
jgi:hypothetical protein